MITKETAVKIFSAHNEIEKAQKLLTELADVVKNDAEKKIPSFHNAFGERRGLQLGVPSGNNGHHLYDVSFDLSVKMIEEHIQQKKRRLEELAVIAKLELNGTTTQNHGTEENNDQ